MDDEVRVDGRPAEGFGTVPLAEICDVAAGPSGALLKRLHDDADGRPVVTPADFTDERAIDARHVRRVPEADGKKLAKFALAAGDLLMVRQGTLGRLALAGAQHTGWFYGSSCLRIRPAPRQVLPGYLMAYLAHPRTREALLDPALPGTVPSFNPAVVRELRVIVPTIERQRLIVETLADMDAAISAQRAMAQRLEAVRPSVFAEMLQGGR